MKLNTQGRSTFEVEALKQAVLEFRDKIYKKKAQREEAKSK